MLGPGVRLLIIDLSRVSFCDVSALAVLIGTQRRARGLGITVRLVALRPQMAKLMHVTGLESHFTICTTLDDALYEQLAYRDQRAMQVRWPASARGRADACQLVYRARRSDRPRPPRTLRPLPRLVTAW